MASSAKTKISNIKNKFLSLKSQVIIETLEELVNKDRKTIYFYLQKAQGNKKEKPYIFNDIVKSLFSFLVKLYFKFDYTSLKKIAEMCRKKIVDNGKIDGALVGSLGNFQKEESFGFFIVNMIHGLYGTQYQEIFINVIEQEPKEEIGHAIIVYLLSLDLTQLEKLEKIPILFQRERLSSITIGLLEYIVRIKDMENGKRARATEGISGIISLINNISGEDVNFYSTIFIAYVGGVFNEIGMENIKHMVEEKIDKHREYKRLIDFSLEDKKNIIAKMSRIVQEQDRTIDVKEQKRDKFWEKHLEEKERNYATYLCETTARLYQLRNDATEQNVSKESNLYQRIVVTIDYLKGILKMLGVEIFGEPGELLTFDRQINEFVDEENVNGKVKAVAPGFILKRSDGGKQVLKKSIVSSK